MNKSILLLVAMTFMLTACVHGRFGDGGYYDLLVQTPDPHFPNVFVVKATEKGDEERLVIDQEPIHVRSGQSTNIAWALQAGSDYEFVKDAFKIRAFMAPDRCDGQIEAQSLVCTLKGDGKTLECKFVPDFFKATAKGSAKFCYELTVMNRKTGQTSHTDPSIMSD